MSGKEPHDPTEDSEFQKVVRHFVTTPHKPHKPLGAEQKVKTKKNDAKSNQSTKRAAKRKKNT